MKTESVPFQSKFITQHWRRDTYTYLFALSFIALLASCSHYLTQRIIKQQETAAKVINLAGRQRMLTQRITLLAGDLISNASVDDHFIRNYQSNIDHMLIVHDALRNGSSKLNIPAPSQTIRAIFNQSPIFLNQQVTLFLTHATELESTSNSAAENRQIYQQLKQAAYHKLLQSLDDLVLEYQQESESDVAKLQTYNVISLVILLFTLLAEAIFIFRPLLLNLYRRETQYHQLLRKMEGEIAERVKFQVFNDPLTGLSNRLSMIAKLETCIQLAKHNEEHLGVVCIGLSRFSSINDSYGHERGDSVLQQLAIRLNQFIEQRYGFISRIAGDEFALALNQQKNHLEILHLIRELSEIINQAMTIGEDEIQLSAVYGLAFYPEDGHKANNLLTHATQAMRMAKTGENNQFQLFQPSMTAQITRRLKLEQRLRRAVLDDTQLVLFYQPKIDLQTGEIIGVEALIRWEHPEEGMLSPAEFIPIAEASNFIVELGDWVLVSALKQIARWNQLNHSIEVAVNVSVKQLLHGNISQRIFVLTQQMNIHPQQVQLEITEDKLMDNLDHIITQLQLLEQYGFILAIDDFGTGHSSLSRLKSLPFKVLKIDQSFVANITTDKNNAQLISAIISMGHSLDKIMIAEGIETIEQMKLLQSLKCEQGQGYLFSRPLPAHEITHLLQHPADMRERYLQTPSKTI
ncbi:putative bifunctional diguanylate cyclase/phosphodiesterase [Celerinatantimonas yamalensis]|uniref:EAL domain-containing protein n=1 Tax=Celerinatantimonas yamalensis TaxID=559956 RepID=A0ABW9G4M5_9GAMM